MPVSKRFVCVHAHLYQPPRENPWTGRVDREESAAPHHDWNDRITSECYGPLAAARLLDGSGRVIRVLNLYSRMSFNVGPTLLGWLGNHAHTVYQAMLDGDRESHRRFGGHGTAMAQAYNHLIMPLATPRDRRTQVRWGVRDFAWRFGRSPEGMWLPETAVDLDTLESLAEEGIRFTVLAPHQAARFRLLGQQDWTDATDGSLDTRQAYLLRLPSGRRIAVFFYAASVAQAVAFEGLLEDGDALAQRLASLAAEDAATTVLAHIATDGETYGHHHRFGEMALARALTRLEEEGDVRLTCYGEFLECHPPAHEAEIHENTSWSCAHGVERWRSDCGCATGAHPDWDQAWRAPLRASLTELSSELATFFDEAGGRLLRDPWEARDEYIDIVLDPSPGRVAGFLRRCAARELTEAQGERARALLEMQRYAMLMFTSCGWFFDDPDRLETRQVLVYAGRALELAEGAGLQGARARFDRALSEVRSHRPGAGGGPQIFESAVQTARRAPSG